MKKILVGIGIILVAIGCFFFFRREENPSTKRLQGSCCKNGVKGWKPTSFPICYRRLSRFGVAICKKYGYEVTDVPVGYDAVLEVAEGKRKER